MPESRFRSHSKAMISSSVGIVILNYRTGDLTIECLQSLASEIDRIRAAIATRGWGRWASLLPLERNGGYAFGNNAGIRRFLESSDPPDLVMLLNPDTTVRPGAVESLRQFMEQHPTVGIVGSQLEDTAGTPQASGVPFPTIFSELGGAVRLGLFFQMV